jgi:hypothetical protein
MTVVEKFLGKKGEDPEIFIYLPMACLLKIVEGDLKLEIKSVPLIIHPFIQELIALREEYGKLD